MNPFAELLARKTQLKSCLAGGGASKSSLEAVAAELKKVNREIEKWIQRHPTF